MLNIQSAHLPRFSSQADPNRPASPEPWETQVRRIRAEALSKRANKSFAAIKPEVDRLLEGCKKRERISTAGKRITILGFSVMLASFGSNFVRSLLNSKPIDHQALMDHLNASQAFLAKTALVSLAAGVVAVIGTGVTVVADWSKDRFLEGKQ